MTDLNSPLLPVADALALVMAHTLPLPALATPLAAALGAVLAEDVVAVEPLPPFAASVKDGYAVVAADGPGDYPLAGSVTAGRLADFVVEPGTVAYITTGAPMPPGADAVVMVEETQRLVTADGVARVRIGRRVKSGQDVRPVGYDVAVGSVVVAAGQRIGPAEIGLCATVGVTQVAVHPLPRVAVLSTGDELVAGGAALKPGQIRDSNGPMLCAAVNKVGGIVVDLGIATDDAGKLEQCIWRGLEEADVLVTSGGVSMGDLDLIKQILSGVATVHFGRLLMKPGKPCTFATVEVGGRTKLVFGLPGNPVSSMVTFSLLVAPALRRLAGWLEPNWRRVQVQLAQTLPLDASRPEYHRAHVHWEAALHHGVGGWLALSTGNQASSRLLSMQGANALLELPQGDGVAAAGSIVSALLIEE